MIARIGKKLAYRDFAAYTTCGLMSAVLVLLVTKGLPIWFLANLGIRDHNRRAFGRSLGV